MRDTSYKARMNVNKICNDLEFMSPEKRREYIKEQSKAYEDRIEKYRYRMNTPSCMTHYCKNCKSEKNCFKD